MCYTVPVCCGKGLAHITNRRAVGEAITETKDDRLPHCVCGGDMPENQMLLFVAVCYMHNGHAVLKWRYWHGGPETYIATLGFYQEHVLLKVIRQDGKIYGKFLQVTEPTKQ
jgi:hypothetical protein